ncbi:MAG TPA: transporter [Burkholderiaceae bacterium]|nr:transporter [Burkholderiaceae bacterium]
MSVSTPVIPFAPAQLRSEGGDRQGLIRAYLFRPGAAPVSVDSAAEAEALLGRIGDGFLWLHLNASRAGADAWMRTHTNLSDNFHEALREGSRSTRIERDGDALFAVINDVTFDFAFDASDVATLWVSVRSDLVVSARRQPLRSVDRLRMAAKHGTSFGSSVALLDELLRDQADELQRIARKATDRVDVIEDAVLTGHHEKHAAELARLRRLMVRLQRMLAPEPSALARTLAYPPAWVAAEDTQRLQQASGEFAVVLRDIGSLQERIKLMQEEAAARISDANARTLFTLTMVTVLALPINLISGLFGMNVGGIPLGDHHGGFWIMVSLIVGLTGLIAWIAVRWIGRGSKD